MRQLLLEACAAAHYSQCAALPRAMFWLWKGLVRYPVACATRTGRAVAYSAARGIHTCGGVPGVFAFHTFIDQDNRRTFTMGIDFQGRVAIVTGAGGGLGRQHALALAQRGAKVLVNDLGSGVHGEGGSVSPAQAVVDEIRAAGGEAVFVRCDVTREAEVKVLMERTLGAYGRLDYAFNNAGISPSDDDSIETTELPAWDRVQDVNLKSVYLCSRAALRHMVPAGRGSIINTASFVALLGSATSQISYTASKGGVLAMTRELGVQFARQGIRVNALCPGPVNTPLLQELLPEQERAVVADDIDTLVKKVVKAAQPGDQILCMSNGGFGGIHQLLLDALTQKVG